MLCIRYVIAVGTCLGLAYLCGDQSSVLDGRRDASEQRLQVDVANRQAVGVLSISVMPLPASPETGAPYIPSIYSSMADDVTGLLAQAIGFDWDDGNAPKVAGRHGVEQGECEQAFFQVPFIVSCDAAHSGREPRWHALGQTGAGRRLLLVFTLRGTLIRVLAARDMNRKERSHYAASAARTKADPDI